MSHAVDDCDSFGLAAAREQKLGRLVQVEEHEAREEHAEGHGSHGVDEVPPAFVDWVRSSQEAPRNQRCDELTDWPPDREESEETSGCVRKELEEKRAVNWKVASDTDTKSSIESTSTDPRGSSSSSNTKDTCEEQGAVEGNPTAHDIRADTPETGSEAKTDEEGASCVSDSLLANIEFLLQRWKRQGNTL